MLATNRMRGVQLGRLKVYVGSDHPHAAQKPAALARVCNPLNSFSEPAAASAPSRASSMTLGQGVITVNKKADRRIFPRAGAAADRASTARGHEAGSRFNVDVKCPGRRDRRPSRRRPPRHRSRAARDGRGAARTAAPQRLAHARPARKRIEEVRPQARPQALPVLETLRGARHPDFGISQDSNAKLYTPSPKPCGINRRS